MKFAKFLMATGFAVVGGTASAQIPIPPFVFSAQEKFDTLTAGTYTGFAGFGGTAGITRIGASGLLVVNNAPATLPILTAPNNMFGRNANVRIKFQGTKKRFGGLFRVPNAGVAVSSVTFRFFKFGAPVGAPMTAPVNNLGWAWRGYNLIPVGGFDEVRIFGNGSLPGYVGMENLRVF